MPHLAAHVCINMKKDFLTLLDFTKEELGEMLTLAHKLKAEQKQGIAHKVLNGKTIGLIFSKSSTRTRVSFEVGMTQLGGYPLFLSANDIQIGRGESIYDTAKVLSRYLDGIMIRTFLQSDVEGLAEHASIPVINGLTDDFHPCQVMADLMTVQEHKGSLDGLKLCYIGDGNNMANSLMNGCAVMGVDIAVATPQAYQCQQQFVDAAKAAAQKNGSNIMITTDPAAAIKDADVVYTDTWISMGQESEKEQKIKDFDGFCINSSLMAQAKSDAIFLHCLPAYRGYEVSAAVIDGPQSVIFDQAENRLHAQKAIMATLMK